MNLQRVGTNQDVVGESPIWCTREQALYWVDIRGPSVRRWESGTNATTTWQMPELVSCVALRESGGLIVALRSALHFFDPATAALKDVASPHRDRPDLRFNDGKVDQSGRFWISSMTLDEPKRQPEGKLFRFDVANGCVPVLDGIFLPNSLCWSPDGGTMYFADSPERTIWAFQFDQSTGEVGERRVFARTESPAVPDGASVDEDGYVWCALFGGWSVVRYAPDGQIDRVIPLPLQQPTSCTFGGADLDVLFITSATRGLSPQALEQQPLAGTLISLQTDKRGVAEPRFAG